MSKKKLLIVCFTFPPYSGIGGRRWAKFAKYLYRNNVDVSIIGAKKKHYNNSQWNQDTDDYIDNVSFIDSNYPMVLQSIPNTLWNKVKYRLALFYVKIFLKGNYYDPSSFWKYDLIKSIENKIKDGYNNIIVSCGPYKMASFAIDLKLKYPKVNFIADFRDPWTTNETSFGYTSISSRRLSYEKELEKKVAKNYDFVLSVSEEMTNYFSSLVNKRNHGNFLTLSNGFDRDDFSNKNEIKRHENKLKLVFTGTLYNKSMHVFEQFCHVLKLLKMENLKIFNSLQIEFYGQMPRSFFELIKDIDCIEFGGEIPLKQVYEKFLSAHVAMLFLSDDLNYSFSTKFYEYISQNIAIAVFSEEGKTGNYVRENGLGYSCFVSNMKDGIMQIYNDWEIDSIKTNSSFDVSKFDVEKISQKIYEILI